MKHLMTLAALFVSSLAMAQIPTFPWNPDGNGDGVIGSSDLIGLLTVYGQEFENAIVSENQESALVYMGQIDLFSCKNSCENLPGNWSLPEPEDIRPIVPLVIDTLEYGDATFWLNYKYPYEYSGFTNHNTYDDLRYPWLKYNDTQSSSPSNWYTIETTRSIGSTYVRCYCSIKQLPRVEYSICNAVSSDSLECANQLVSDGWYPMGSVSDSGTQAFWRFAQ